MGTVVDARGAIIAGVSGPSPPSSFLSQLFSFCRLPASFPWDFAMGKVIFIFSPFTLDKMESLLLTSSWCSWLDSCACSLSTVSLQSSDLHVAFAGANYFLLACLGCDMSELFFLRLSSCLPLSWNLSFLGNNLVLS